MLVTGGYSSFHRDLAGALAAGAAVVSAARWPLCLAHLVVAPVCELTNRGDGEDQKKCGEHRGKSVS